MAITTFSDLILSQNAKKIVLVEIEPSELLTIWTNHAGNIYYSSVDAGIDIQSIDEDGTALTEVATLAAVSAGEWFHDHDNERVYIEMTGSDAPYTHDVVANHKVYISNEPGVIFNNHFYEPLLIGTPTITQKKQDMFWGISITSGGSLSLKNADTGDGTGYFDSIYTRYTWINKNIKILWGGEDLPYSEYVKAFFGKISDKHFSTNLLDFSYKDSKDKWDTVIPVNTFDQTTYPNLADEDVGKAIPYGWGTINNQIAYNVQKGLGTATSIWQFKFVDTSLNSVSSIDQIYVKGNPVTHHSGDVTTGAFKLSSTVYTIGDDVTLDYTGYVSGSVVQNPVSVLVQIGNQIGETYDSATWSTSSVETAQIDADEFPVGVSIGEKIKAIDIVSDIMRSCMGTFYVNNDGLYCVSIWSPNIEENLTEVNEIDILDGTFKSDSGNDDIRKTIIVGWAKDNFNDKYRYDSITMDLIERLYGIKKERTILTLLSTVAGVGILKNRIALLNKYATIDFKFTTKLQLALKNIGDRISVAFKRLDTNDNLTWVDFQTVEIKSIVKDFLGNKIQMIVDNLRGIGVNVGNWTEEDSANFPAELGGGSGDPWDSSWSLQKKAYAKNHWGYWTDNNGFADSSDSDSYKISIWW